MKPLLAHLKYLISPSPKLTDPIERSHRVWLARVIFFVLPLGFIAAIIPPLFDTSVGFLEDTDFVILLGSLIFWIIPLFLNHAGHYQSAAIAMMTIAGVIIAGTAYFDNTISDLHYLIMPIIFGSVLLPTRMVWKFSLASVVLILLFPLATGTGYTNVLADPLIYFAMGFVLLQMGNAHRDRIETFRREELEQTHEKLRIEIIEREQAERKAMEVDLERERVRLMTGFITNMSHDFKTPLTTINTNLYLIKRSAGNVEKQGHYIETIENQTTRLQELVEGLLEMTRLDTNITLNLHEVNINHLIQDALERIKSQHPNNNVEFALNLDNSLPRILVDPHELVLALSKIMENALIYSPPNSSVHIRSYKDGTCLIVEIKDSGIGIDEADKPFIFSRFFRADRSRSTQTGAKAGLGLPIAQKIVQAHGGEIEVQSALGRGSTFRVYLPTTEAPCNGPHSRPVRFSSQKPNYT